MSVTQIVGNYCSFLEETNKVHEKFGENLPLIFYIPAVSLRTTRFNIQQFYMVLALR
jgi:hypothetical protein